MENRCTALVRGPSPVFPRGWIAVITLWCAVIGAGVDHFGHLPAWYGRVALGGLLVAALTLIVVLATMRNNAFAADEDGISLGLRGGARRRVGRFRRRTRQLPWAEIQQISIAPRLYGARLEIVLSPAAHIVHRPGTPRRIVVGLATLILPLCYLLRAPGLLAPRFDPPRYRIPLCEVGADPLRSALTALAAPAGVPVNVAPRWRRPAAPAGLRRVAAAPAALSSADLQPVTGPRSLA